MSENIFNDNMTYIEASRAFFEAIEGKTEEEISIIKKEFEKIIPSITKKELDGSFSLSNNRI